MDKEKPSGGSRNRINWKAVGIVSAFIIVGGGILSAFINGFFGLLNKPSRGISRSESPDAVLKRSPGATVYQAGRDIVLEKNQHEDQGAGGGSNGTGQTETNVPGRLQVSVIDTNTLVRMRGYDLGANAPSLHDLFKADFNTLIKVSKGVTITKPKDWTPAILLEVDAQVYSDYESGSKFVGFWIPVSMDTPAICQALADQCKVVMQKIDDALLHSEGYPGRRGVGEHTVKNEDLRFTGRVFIYHEADMFPSEIEDLRAYYKQRGLSVQFRGLAYLTEVSERQK